MHDGQTVIDADGHIMEPPDLWERFIDPEFYGVRPILNQAFRGSVEVMGRRMSRSYENELYRDHVNKEWQERHVDAEARGYDVESHLDAMDQMGIDEMYLYPSVGLFAAAIADLDGKVASAICRAYNRWLAEFASRDPRRLHGVGLVGLQDPILAAAEARYAVQELGFTGIMVRPNPAAGRNLHDPANDVFYAEVAELDVPLATHEGCGVWMPEYGVDRFSEHIAWHAMCHPMEQMGAVLSFTMGGIMERHPSLRVGILEAGGTWLPYWLSRLDEHVEWIGHVETPYLTMLPSEYFRRQGWIGFEAEEPGIGVLLDFVGRDRILWASDYPHPDAGSDPVKEVASVDAIGKEELGMILESNPRAFYKT